MEVRPAAQGERELRLGAALHPPLGAERIRGLRAGQRRPEQQSATQVGHQIVDRILASISIANRSICSIYRRVLSR